MRCGELGGQWTWASFRIGLVLFLSYLGLLNAPGTFGADAESPYYALLIGNNAYETGRLRNPVNDVNLLGTALQDLDFVVTIETDLSHREMDAALFRFVRSVPKGGLAFFYFAGHGIGIKNDHFLIPVDAELEDAASLKYDTVSQDFVLDALNESDANTKVLMMDCCRNNPFERAWPTNQRSNQTNWSPRSEAPDGTLIAYATAENQPALDGQGDNSPFASNLTKELKARPDSGLYLLDVVRSASEAVKKQTGQRAWVHFDSSMPRVCLKRPLPTNLQEAVPQQFAPRHDIAAEMKEGDLVSKEEAPKPTKTSSAGSFDPSIFNQAKSYLEEGKYDLAINAYSAILADSNASAGDQTLARRDRISAYIRRGQENDLDRALIDAKAIGEAGIQLPFLAESGSMRIEKERTGTIHRHQIATITATSGDLVYVASIYGGADQRGWVKRVLFRPQTVMATIAPPSNPVVPPSNISKPETDNVPSFEMPSVQPKPIVHPQVFPPQRESPLHGVNPYTDPAIMNSQQLEMTPFRTPITTPQPNTTPQPHTFPSQNYPQQHHQSQDYPPMFQPSTPSRVPQSRQGQAMQRTQPGPSIRDVLRPQSRYNRSSIGVGGGARAKGCPGCKLGRK